MTASKSGLAFRSFIGAPSPFEKIEFSLTGTLPSDTYFVSVTSETDRFDAEVLFAGSTAKVTLRPYVTNQATDKAGLIKFNLCRDSNCANVIWTQTLPYTLKFVDITPISISFHVAEGQDADPVNLISNPSVEKELKVSVPSGQSWIKAVQSADSIWRIGASAKGLAPGVYQGSAAVAFAGIENSPTISIPVALTVGGGVMLTGTQPVEVTANTSQSVITGSGVLSFNTGSPAWSVSSDKPWLKLSAVNGMGGGVLGWQIDLSKLGISNWSSATANIVVQTNGLSAATFPLTVSMKLPDVYAVSADALSAGVSGSVTVQGKGFSQLGNVSVFRIDGLPVSGGTIVSDTQVLLTLPALASGAHTLAVANASGLTSLGATINVGAPSGNTYAVVNGLVSGNKTTSKFDAVRNAIFSVDPGNQQLIRMRKSGQAWQMATLAVPNIGDLALAPDHGTVYVTSGADTLLAIDPDRLVVRATFTTAQLSAAVSSPSAVSLLGRGGGLAVTADGRIWFSGTGSRYLVYFDMGSLEFKAFVSPGNSSAWIFADPQAVAPANGTYFILVNKIGGGLAYRYTAASGAFDSYDVGLTYAASEYLASNDGSRIIANQRVVLDVSGKKVIGTLPMESGLAEGVLFSPNGNRIYRMISEQSVADYIEVIDAATLTLSGTIPVPERDVVCWYDGAGCSGASFAISDDGGTLFLVGRTKTVVLPVPSSLARQGGRKK